MPLETIGVRAIVEGLEKYTSDLRKVETSTQNATKKVSASVNQLSNAGAPFVSMSSKMVGAASNTNGALAGMSNAMGGAGISMAALATGALVAIPALIAVGKAAIGAANDAMELGLAVSDMSDKLGTSAEESSRLIAMADDLRIPTTSLATAFRTLMQNGIQPTTENLIRLGEQYRAIVDPVKRAEFAMETFGARSGLEMTRLLQTSREELTAMGNEHERLNLIMGQDGVQSAKAYNASLDNLGDAWQGLKIAFGTPIMGTITIAIRTIMEGLGITATPATQRAEDEAAAKAAGFGIGAPGQGTPEQRKAQVAAHDQYIASIQTGRALEREREIRKGIAWIQTDSLALAERQVELEHLHELALGNVATAQTQYKAAQQEALGVAQENVGIIGKYTTEGSQKQIDALKIVDKVYGTNYATNAERIKREDKLYRDYSAKRITAAQYEEGLRKEKTTIMDPAIAAMKDAEGAVNRFQDKINSLKGKTIVITQICKGYLCPAGSKVGLTGLEGLNTGQGPGEQQATGGPLASTAIVGERGWEAIINGVVIPHAQSVAMAAMGALQPKARHAAGGFIDPASLAYPLTQSGRGGNSRSVNIGQISISADIERQAFLSALRRAVM